MHDHAWILMHDSHDHDHDVHDNHVQAKANLQKFVESFHQRASTLTTWVSSLEAPANPNPTPRQVQQLSWQHNC